MHVPAILIVEDDPRMQKALCQIMSKDGYLAKGVSSGEAGLSMMKEQHFDLVITDFKLPGIDGLDVLRGVRRSRPDTSVVMITAYASVDSAVLAMKEGADDYVAKPFNLDEIRLVVKRVIEHRGLVARTRDLEEQLKRKYQLDNIIGTSEPMIQVFKTVQKIKDSKSTVLILGETGTGKDLVARALHFNSVRKDRPYIPVNCASLTESLMGSELFGHVKGSFTGAIRDRVGIFESAAGGTVFLDEIGDVSLSVQTMLLRVLEDGVVQPVGSVERRKVDVRIITATNRNLWKMCEQGLFREDLYYRLDCLSIDLPPLRDRRHDIILLAQHFLEKYSRVQGGGIKGFSPEALEVLDQYPWPGNVRELEHAVERACLLESGELITISSLPPRLREFKPGPGCERMDEFGTLQDMSRAYILQILEQTGGNRARAAEILGINRTSLWRMMKRLNISDGACLEPDPEQFL